MLNNGENLIVLPNNPFWDVFRRFGTDEFIALAINFFATLALSLMFVGIEGNSVIFDFFNFSITLNILLAGAGPVVEKIGFFPAHIKEALDMYRSTPVESRKKLSYYVKRAMRGGTKSLLQDIFIHDPLYVGIMYVGLTFSPGTQPAILAVFSFIVAVLIVAGLEVGFVEALYRRCSQSLKKMGFKKISYLESRFHFDSHETAEKVFTLIKDKYDLGCCDELDNFYKGQPSELRYKDRYLSNRLPIYNARKPRIRFRQRDFGENGSVLKSVQVVFTLVSEMAKKEISQYRYYPIRKDKLYYQFSREMCWKISDILDRSLRIFLEKFEDRDGSYEIEFIRTVANNPETLLVSVDRMSEVAILEIKAYHHNKRLLKEAMCIAMQYGGSQTTHDKKRIARMGAV